MREERELGFWDDEKRSGKDEKGSKLNTEILKQEWKSIKFGTEIKIKWHRTLSLW